MGSADIILSIETANAALAQEQKDMKSSQTEGYEPKSKQQLCKEA
jgi:hypothetical protein